MIKYLTLSKASVHCDVMVHPKYTSTMHMWKTILGLKHGTALLNYNCKFKDGSCKVSRYCATKDPHQWNAGKMCCCANCRDQAGYIGAIREDHQLIYLRAWDQKTGFWREDGCALPRKYRSTICIKYHCANPSGNKTEKQIIMYEYMQALENTLDNLYSKIYQISIDKEENPK